MRALIVLLAWLVALPAQAMVLRNDFGGLLTRYLTRYRAAIDRGEHVVIDGVCASACTLVVGLAPRARICITPRAELQFHSAAFDVPGHPYSEHGTRLMWALYPKDVRAAIERHGWDGHGPHPDVIVIRGAELRALFHPCH